MKIELENCEKSLTLKDFEEISKSDWYKYIKESDNKQQTD